MEKHGWALPSSFGHVASNDLPSFDAGSIVLTDNPHLEALEAAELVLLVEARAWPPPDYDAHPFSDDLVNLAVALEPL